MPEGVVSRNTSSLYYTDVFHFTEIYLSLSILLFKISALSIQDFESCHYLHFSFKFLLQAKPFEEFEKLPSPRILNTHVDFRYLPADVEKLKCKIVFVLRNPKDVMVSHYNHVVGCKAYKYDGKWENFYRLYVEGKSKYLYPACPA